MSAINNAINPVTTDLCQFIYVSRITSTGLSSPSTLSDISEISIRNNEEDAITGVLCYGNGYFLQCVEGSEQDLTNLKNRLLLDNRHKEMKILSFEEITERRFFSWWLRSIMLERWITKGFELKEFMPFEPYNLDDKELKSFLNILQEYYQDQVRTGSVDTSPVKYSTLGVTLSKVVGQHQAFFLIQTVLGVLVVMALLWLMLSDKIW
ncbi:BLUF domain-containing protein [Psychrobacter sp.]|uniref:BLUF domain-containing protein n=2 Tax=Psychrobacter sp. TaxID=56811 RepID=UPI00264742F4|nr:BLUF domain-containing protein [Psychrobacter sp.]MDN6307962.1 BLUF domain-containing protein [Psychrobacter sp.]